MPTWLARYACKSAFRDSYSYIPSLVQAIFLVSAFCVLTEEAQLSQRDRAMLRVIEYFAKSLKVNQCYSKRHPLVRRV